MTDGGRLAFFLAAALALSLAWARALWYFDERSPLVRRLLFWALGHLRTSAGRLKALLLSALYCALGGLAGALLALTFGLPFRALFGLEARQWSLAILGIVGEISLANLLVSVGTLLPGFSGGARFAEVEEIPWMKGMAELPRWAVPLLAALAAVVEELFFRGVVLGLLLMRFGLAPALAIAISALLFLLGQLIQVRTAFQALVVGSGSVAIGLVGGLLVAATGSVVLAVVAHASFVVFFLARGERARNQFGGPAREVVAR